MNFIYLFFIFGRPKPEKGSVYNKISIAKDNASSSQRPSIKSLRKNTFIIKTITLTRELNKDTI